MNELYEQIYKIVDQLIDVACDYEQGEDVDLDAKANESYHAIKALIADQVRKARIEEQQRYLNMLETGEWRSFAIEVTDRIAQLRSTQ